MSAGSRPLRILQVSTSDVAGGAERSASNLAAAFRAMGHESWLAVGNVKYDQPTTFAIANDDRRNALVRSIDRLRNRFERRGAPIRGVGRVLGVARAVAEPLRTLSIARGEEDFEYPATEGLLELPPSRPDILHLHNLHGNYFDLRALPRLSSRVATVLNVRDAWLMSGHCAFGLDCERWKTGCGDCPDLTLFPAVARDATAFNWARKQSILAGSRLNVTTPSQWMMDRVLESIIAPGAVRTRVIPNGVDTATFFPGDRAAARAAVGASADEKILLVAANGLRSNVWKDYVTLRKALELLGATVWPAPIRVIAVGEEAPSETIGNITLTFVPFQRDSAQLADYYRAADVYLHAARVESFGNVLLEARACGTPIVATAVGGIPEQVRALDCEWLPRGLRGHDLGNASGVLVPQRDPAAFAGAVAMLLRDDNARNAIAANGIRHVHNELSLELQAARFVEWYREILAARDSSATHAE